MEEKKVPALRFRGFDNAWEQRRLGELGHTEGGTSIESEFDSEGKYKVISIGSYSEESDYVDQGIRAIESEKTLRRVLQKNDLTMILNDKTSSGKIIGRVLFIDRSDVFVYNQRTEMIRGYEDRYYPKFLYHLLNAPIQRKKIVKQSQGNTQIYVNWSKVSETQYMIPEVGEQTIISNYFSYFDHLISLHQRKLEMLKKVKKSMLEKMFPKNDAKVPEVRFSDFTDAWEQRRLGELGHTEGGTSIESEFDSEGKYKVISIGSYSEESDYVDQGIRAIESEKTLRRVLQKNDLTMILNDKTSSGKIIGRVLFIDRSDVFVYNQRTEMIRGYEDRYYPKFLYHLLNAPIQRKKIVKQSQGNTQIYVNWSKVSETQYMIPEVGEQTIISNYFSYFDHLISLHQRKLEKLKNIKKSMLEKMFII